VSGRHRQLLPSRAVNSRILGAGAAGLAVAIATAPLAGADPVAPTSSDSPVDPTAADASTPDTSATDASTTTASTPTASTPTASIPTTPSTPRGTAVKKAAPKVAVTEPVEADFGIGKVRVGVQIKDGSWVPPGTSTAGTKIKIEETGPGVDGTLTTICTTQADSATPSDDPSATFCEFGTPDVQSGTVRPGIVIRPTPPGVPPFGDYMVAPGDSLRLVQETVNPNLLRDGHIATVGPCAPVDFGFCESLDVIFEDPGLPPKAIDDSASTVSADPVGIDVLANDVTQGAPATVDSATNPAHGTAVITATGIQYTPNAGFVGLDTFEYTMSTPNGTSAATVRVTVTGPAPSSTPPTSPPTTPPSSSQPPTTGVPTSTSTTAPPPAPNGSGSNLANTGVASGNLLDLAGGFLLAGGAATALGRRSRRPRGRHV
jgi:Bacterial Ig domain